MKHENITSEFINYFWTLNRSTIRWIETPLSLLYGRVQHTDEINETWKSDGNPSKQLTVFRAMQIFRVGECWRLTYDFMPLSWISRTNNEFVEIFGNEDIYSLGWRNLSLDDFMFAILSGKYTECHLLIFEWRWHDKLHKLPKTPKILLRNSSVHNWHQAP